MKLHLPKALLFVILAAYGAPGICSAITAIPAPGSNASTAIWTDTGWTNADGTSINGPQNPTSGQYYIFNTNSSTLVGDVAVDTSDGGGVYVKDGVKVTNLILGDYAGIIYVGSDSSLHTKIDTTNGVLKSMDDTKTNVWVDGHLTLKGLRKFGGGGKNHIWHIGENGYIDLSDTSSVVLNNKTWSIELIHDTSEPNYEGIVNRELEENLEFTRTFMRTGGNLTSFMTLKVYDKQGNELTAGTDYQTAHTDTGLAITYTKAGYSAIDLTWNGGENGTWEAVGSDWVNSDNEKTSFLNGDNVTFNSTSNVTVSGKVAANDLTITSGNKLTLSANENSSLRIEKLDIKGSLESSTSIDIGNSVAMADEATWTLASGATQSLTQAQMDGVSSIAINKEASLRLTDITASEGATLNFSDKISGSGIIALELRNDNGVRVNLSSFSGDIEVRRGLWSNKGNLQLPGSTFNKNSTIILAEDGSGIVINENDYALENNVRVDGAGKLHVNSNVTASTLNSTITGNGTLTKEGAGALDIKGTITTTFDSTAGTLNVKDTASITTLVVSGGTANITTSGLVESLKSTGGTTTLAGEVTVGTIGNTGRTTGLYAHTGTLYIGDGSTETKVLATRLESGDADPGNGNQTGGIINIADKATLVITANVDSLGSTTFYKTHGLMLGAWGSTGTPLLQSSTLNVSGDFLAQNIQAAIGDSTAIVNIESGGKMAVKGITSCVSQKSDMQLNVKDGGTLILGASGIHDLKNLTGSFAAGTVGISADATIAENISLSSENGTTFDTTKYVWSDDGTSIEMGSEGGKLTISGVISDHSVTTTTGEGDDATTNTTIYNGKLVKDGLGTLELQGANTYTGGTEVKAGMLIASTGAGLSSGGVTVKGGSVEVTDAGDGAKVVVGKSGSTDATFVYNGAGSASGGTGTTYSVDNAAYSINNAAVEVSNENGTTISNRLQGVALSNTGTGLLTAGNGYNNLTEIIAETGDINLTWFAEQANQGTVTNLTIGEGRTVGVYAGHAADGVEKDITVSSLTAGSGAKLNANLILTTKASLTLDGALAMGSTLTLGTALTLDETTLQAIMGLSAGEKHALFTGVDALTLNGATYTKGMVLDSTTGPDLGTYFVLADAGTPAVLSDTTAASGYYLGYTAEGMVYAGKVIPEPTTATLSLLALAALAARRRRK